MAKRIISVLISVFIVLFCVVFAFADEEFDYYDYPVQVEDGYGFAPNEYYVEEYGEFENNAGIITDEQPYIEDYPEEYYYDDGEEYSAELYIADDYVKERKLFSVKRIAAALIAGFIIAFIAMKIKAAPLKSVKSCDNANYYEIKDSFNLSFRNDRFLYSNVSKTPIPKQTNTAKK